MAILWLSLCHNGSLMARKLFLHEYLLALMIWCDFYYFWIPTSIICRGIFHSFKDVMKGASLWNYFALLFNFHFFNHSSHPVPVLKKVKNSNQFKYWNNFAFMFDSHFSNHSSHPIPPTTKNIKHLEFVFGTEVLICQKNLRVVGRGLGW